MHFIKKVTDDLLWVGSNDRRLSFFEGVYSVPYGVSYNSYLLLDEKVVVFDTVDKTVKKRFFENLDEALCGKEPDFFIMQHMEPDHSAAVEELVRRYPGMKIVCNARTLEFAKQFYGFDFDSRVQIVAEGDTLNTGRHELSFIMAPMVHWPEVMVTYDSTDHILFSADGFGCFGALNGALFADEVDFAKDYMDEARRYYTNIVGKYGDQVSALLKKASALRIDYICPLHGFVWRSNINDIVSKYILWSSYTPEDYGVMIAYASVYGNTENTAEILSGKLRDRGVRTVMFDVSVTPASEIVSAAFRWSHLVFASTTYNAGIFVAMEAVVNDIVAHNIQKRTVGIIENGSWAPTSGGLIREHMGKCDNISFIDDTVSLRSSLNAEQLSGIDAMVNSIIDTLPATATVKREIEPPAQNSVDMLTMFKLSYGLFVLTAKDGDKDNGCIINTAAQITEKPLRISIAVNKANFTHDMVLKTGRFNVSILSQSVPFRVFEQFGFRSGRDTDKFAGCGYDDRTANGIRYVPEGSNGVISGQVAESYDYGTHTLFIADVTQAFILSGEPSTTYQYYFDNIKPKPQPKTEPKQGFVCKICGYEYEGETLPEDFVCPLCKHGPADFEPM